MQPYEIKITADIHDVDENGIVRTSALMRYMQSAAQCQLTDNGMSYEKRKNVHFFSRVSVWNSTSPSAPMHRSSPPRFPPRATVTVSFVFTVCPATDVKSVVPPPCGH